MTKANIEELNKVTFEEAVNILKKLGYVESDNIESDDTNIADMVEDTYFVLYDENDEEKDMISFERHCNVKNPDTENELIEKVLEKWERI